jgi:hypothetical protein
MKRPSIDLGIVTLVLALPMLVMAGYTVSGAIEHASLPFAK